jgi:DNA repair exonuclease SbcCD ATPase subunit
MKIKRMQFRGENVMDFSCRRRNVTIIYGECLTGKSTLLGALRWCLCGKETRDISNERAKMRPIVNLGVIDDALANSCDEVKANVSVDLQYGQKTLTITRQTCGVPERDGSRYNETECKLSLWERLGRKKELVSDPSSQILELYPSKRLDLSLLNLESTSISADIELLLNTWRQSQESKRDETRAPIEREINKIHDMLSSLHKRMHLVITRDDLLVHMDSVEKAMPVDSLSAGQKSLLHLAIRLAVLRTTYPDTPIVIDDPLFRMDEEAREHALSVLPSLYPQIILLEKRLFEQSNRPISSHVGKEYRLTRNLDDRTTKIAGLVSNDCESDGTGTWA